ncbi:MAG: hypothetical protein KF868_13055 [Acidobacteria bacterium]|nr:hypothetical protein [Acidobacteriota bacterium]
MFFRRRPLADLSPRCEKGRMNQVSRIRRVKLVFICILAVVTGLSFWPAQRSDLGAAGAASGTPKTGIAVSSDPSDDSADNSADAQQQRQARVNPKSAGCIACHTGTESMHHDGDNDLGIGCADCHGGDPAATTKEAGHVKPRFPEIWKSTANPEHLAATWVKESDEFIRFVNPGDFRAADLACGKCHEREVAWSKKSMMTHGGMLWAAALYNNGAYPFKDARFGESFGPNGAIQMVFTNPPPTPEETRLKGILTFLQPLPRWPITQPGNVLRVFERGGELKGLPSDIGSPPIYEIPGKPEVKLSDRGFGTRLRTDPVFLGLQKTRLLDPILSMLGTNDNPGDYRSSGCTACHVVYANDRDPKHSSKYAEFGNEGKTFTADPTIPKNESGHPIKHQMTAGPPSSQCMVCHIHPGTNMVTTYYGMTWWDNETDGDLMYPEKQPKLSAEEKDNIQYRNPEGSALRGRWGQDREFLKNIWTDVNPKAKRTQFGDFHGHGWVFRNVYRTDRKGNMLNSRGTRIDPDDPEKFKKAVHLEDVHQKFGMHCADCHVGGDVHGNGNLYNEPRAAIQVDCIDCHGTIDKPATLMASGPAAGTGRFKGRVVTVSKDLRRVRARDERGRQIPMFQVATAERPIRKKDAQGRDVEFKAGEIIQNSLVEPGKWWRVVQTVDTVTPGKRDYNDASAWAKTVQRDGRTWADTAVEEKKLAHANSSMTCYACHSSWTTSCVGCHLPMTANKQKPMLHNEGEDRLRNWTQYNFQTLRDDFYMLGKDGTVTGRRIAPTRSTCAILVGSQNQNREWIYSQQQTISSEGYSGQAFSTYVPHTVSTSETKVCTDCHISRTNDNNAWMAQLLMQGTNFTNFIGRFAYVAAGKHGLQAVVVTERDEPQAVLGSDLHKIAYPEEFEKHVKGGRILKEAYEHKANGEALSIQLRGEYLYVANGPGGLRVYDAANIDNKGFSERIATAPFSPFGQRFYVKSKYATAVASPTTLGVDPTRNHRPENEEAQYRDDKQAIHLMYAFLYVTDKYEGLFTVLAATLLDGNPANNFLKRQLTFNPEGKLNGASNITIAGHYAYITADRGLLIVDINDPLNPKIVSEIPFKRARAVQVQFRYAFVLDEEGMHVVDVTNPDQAKLVEAAKVPIEDAHNLYLVRTYAYVAAGKNGLVLVDIERAERPKIELTYNAEGKINDSHDVKVGMTNNSQFAYIADGHNGVHVVQMLSPAENATIYGFSPKPTPRLIATFPMKGEALAISEGLDRDRAVDETGQQLSVFNRRGARPFNKAEMRRMYMHDDGTFYNVTDDVPPRPRRPAAPRTGAEAGGGSSEGGSTGAGLSDFASGGLMHLFVSLLLLVGGVRTVRRRQ